MPPKRPRNALVVGVTAAMVAPAALLGSAATAAVVTARAAAVGMAKPAAAPRLLESQGQQPTCGKASDLDFPIDTRIHGGPAVHHPGGGFQEWSVELANTTAETCRNIHPVIIFAGRERGLTPAGIALAFYDEGTADWRPVVPEATAEDEIVGVLDGPGLAVPARKTITVKVRLALAAGTPPNEVTVNAAIVQRQGEDGDWVGESGDYRFAVLDEDAPGADASTPAGTADPSTGPSTGPSARSSTGPSASPSPSSDPGIDPSTDPEAAPPDELAATGTESVLALGAAIGAVLLCGGALAVTRRLRARRR
jgi:hypothetical protein